MPDSQLTGSPTLSDVQRTVIEAIHAPWSLKVEWPKVGRLAAQLKREAGIKNLESVLDSLPKWSVAYRQQDHEPIRLTMRGLSFCPVEKPVVDAFLALHRMAAQFFIGEPTGNPRITSTHLRTLLPDLSEERFKAVSELILEDFSGGSYTHPEPGEWSREPGEGSLRYESVADIEEFLRRRDCKTEDIEILGPVHVALLSEAYKYFRKEGRWQDYREFMVEHRVVGDILKLFSEINYKGFFELRQSGAKHIEMRLSFKGIVASGSAQDDLEILAKAVGIMCRHYGQPEGEDPVPAARISHELRINASALDRLGYLLGTANVGINVSRVGNSWSARASRYIETFDGVDNADDLFSVWHPGHQGRWRGSYLKVTTNGPTRQTITSPVEISKAGPGIETTIVGRRLKSAPIEIVRYVQSGGSADVYEGTVVDQATGLAPKGTRIAVKITKDWLLYPDKIEETRHRVQREGSLKGTEHPNLARSYGSFEEELLGRQRPVVLLEFIDGITLKEWVAVSGAASTAQFARFILPVIDALELLHSKGIIHRDVKPSNVMVRRDAEGRVVLMDLGIAHFKDENEVTGSQVCMGTKRRAAPEFLFRSPPEAANDPMVDVYSLGTLAYDLLTGKEFLGHIQNEAQIVLAVKDDIPVINAGVFPGEIVQLVERMLAKKPSERPSLGKVKAFIEKYCGKPNSKQGPSQTTISMQRSPASGSAVSKQPDLDIRLTVSAVDSYEMGVGSKQMPKSLIAVKIQNHDKVPVYLEPGFHFELSGSTEKVWVIKDPMYGGLLTERTLEPGNAFTVCFDATSIPREQCERLGRVFVVDKIGRWFGSSYEEVRKSLRELGA